MKNIFTVVGCCLISAAAFASGTLPGKANSSASGINLSAAGHEAVVICHKGRQITVDANAVPAHLAHGDKVGSCSGTPGTPGKSAATSL